MSSSLFISKLRVSLKIGHLSPSLHICVDFFYFPICTVTYGSIFPNESVLLYNLADFINISNFPYLEIIFLPRTSYLLIVDLKTKMHKKLFIPCTLR